jgi:hypothetical protein
MYAWLWRHLPGNVSLRIAQSLVLLIGIIALLLFVVFPAVEPHLPFGNVTITPQK